MEAWHRSSRDLHHGLCWVWKRCIGAFIARNLLAFGAVVALVIIAIGRWSGAHINPAVSIAFGTEAIFRQTTLAHVLGQLVGALFAGLLLNGAGPIAKYHLG